ncbi:hypothetical protein Pan153_24400 [Gimesia panareensis]|uniref:Uncharacterized protein n=1 Tax=Gimesia panareensis TaxID=2527978 RepID=A0A518FNE4_9PLAN|nr:hypothetical protein Pan153_24400 [Gimesia panareensis]
MSYFAIQPERERICATPSIRLKSQSRVQIRNNSLRADVDLPEDLKQLSWDITSQHPVRKQDQGKIKLLTFTRAVRLVLQS